MILALTHLASPFVFDQDVLQPLWNEIPATATSSAASSVPKASRFTSPPRPTMSAACCIDRRCVPSTASLAQGTTFAFACLPSSAALSGGVFLISTELTRAKGRTRSLRRSPTAMVVEPVVMKERLLNRISRTSSTPKPWSCLLLSQDML